MKKGDILYCNDGINTVELVSFDDKWIVVLYKGRRILRPVNIIGKKLHYKNTCWNCGRGFIKHLKKCNHCSTLICSYCDSCQLLECNYHNKGFDKAKKHRNGTFYSDGGFDVDGFNVNGRDRQGYDREGYDREGFNHYGYDRDGYDKEGFNHYGYDREGYDKEGFNINNYNRSGVHRDGTSI